MSEDISIVYLYGFSLRQRDKSESLIKIFKEHIQQKSEIILILLHDGAIGITHKGKIPPILEILLQMPIKIYVLTADILARGLELKNLRNNIKAIDYEDLVDILVNNQKVVSWI